MKRKKQNRNHRTARRRTSPALYRKYPLPDYLVGRITESLFDNWLNERANTLRQRELKRKKPYALVTTKGMYKGKIYAAVVDAGEFDPFPGDALEWELISSWNSDKAKEGGDEYPLRTRSGLPILSGAFCYGMSHMNLSTL